MHHRVQNWLITWNSKQKCSSLSHAPERLFWNRKHVTFDLTELDSASERCEFDATDLVEALCISWAAYGRLCPLTLFTWHYHFQHITVLQYPWSSADSQEIGQGNCCQGNKLCGHDWLWQGYQRVPPECFMVLWLKMLYCDRFLRHTPSSSCMWFK